MKLYKNGKCAICDKDQLKLMLASGWSRENVPEKKAEIIEEPTILELPVEEDEIEETPEDEENDDDASPVGSKPRKRLLKKKKD